VSLVSSQQAMANAARFARYRTHFRQGWCDHVVAVENGLSYSGYASATAHFRATPQHYRHGTASTPPGGALVFWTGGSHGHGHIALSMGGGICASTDIVATGYVNFVRIALITQRWGLSYVGWTDAYYGPQGVRVIHPHVPVPPKPPPPKPPVPAEIGPDEMFMYRSTYGYAVLVEGGKQVVLDAATANAFVGDASRGHLDGPAPTYVAVTKEQEATFQDAWGPVVHHKPA
jgi:hypothetical protein